MAREEIGLLLGGWTDEPVFCEQMRADLEAGVRDSGVELDDEEWAARSMDWARSDEELVERASKVPGS